MLSDETTSALVLAAMLELALLALLGYNLSNGPVVVSRDFLSGSLAEILRAE